MNSFPAAGLGLDPYILQNNDGESKTLIEALEQRIYKEAAFGIVLLTPRRLWLSEEQNDDKDRQPRARQNVILELGMVLASVGREHMVLLKKGALELPTDVSGVIYLEFNEHVKEVAVKLATRMKGAGIRIRRCSYSLCGCVTMSGHTERDFETAIEAGLTSSAGYETRNPSAYDEALAFFPDDVSGFLKDSQPAKWQALEALLGPKAAATLLDSLWKELELKGTLHVLRHGFKCFGKTFRMAYFRPNTRMNPKAAENYAKNRLTITRQVAFTSVREEGGRQEPPLHHRRDLCGQRHPRHHRRTQEPADADSAPLMRYTRYENDRDGRDLLFAFKKRALVHFAVDPDEIWMTTRLRGKETHFLPFNRGNNHGAGNPPVEGNWKTHYLWDEVLQVDSLLEILQRFMHLEVKEKQVKTDKGVRTVRKETMIFPRYHQLDAVRKLVEHAKVEGAGRNYLIQHSAGSGKSNSIAWLAHRLASLHDERDEKVFHSVIVGDRPACARSAIAVERSTSSSTRPAWSRRSTRTPSSLPERCPRVHPSSSQRSRNSPSSRRRSRPLRRRAPV